MGSDTMLTTTMATIADADQQRDVAAPHASLVEAAHALGVDEHRAEPEPGQERRRHAPPALVEELHHRGVGADGDDELGAAS